MTNSSVLTSILLRKLEDKVVILLRIYKVVVFFIKGEKEDALTIRSTHWKASATIYSQEEKQNQERSVDSQRQVVLHVSMFQLANRSMREQMFCC